MNTPKLCKHCRATFTPRYGQTAYCPECRGLLACVSCGKKLNVHFNRVVERRRRCFSCYKEVAEMFAARGADHHFWKGGRAKTTNGYVEVHKPEHPRSSGRGYVYEHILVAERKLGRPMKSTEVTHHINKIRHDNRPENITVMSKTAHDRLHKPDRELAQYGRITER